MESYPLYIDGADDEGDGWTYVIRASALIENPRRALELKRALELGEKADEHDESAVVGRCAWGGTQHNRRAVEAACRASRRFGQFPLGVRKAIAADVHRSLEDHADKLIELLVAEGHPRKLATWEISGVLSASNYESREWWFGQLHQEFEDDERLLVLERRPDGVVCVNPPQNTAGSTSALGIIPLFAGNTVVIKAPRSVPLSVMYLYREIVLPVLQRHGAPPGTLNVISGDSRRILREWLTHPDVADIFFVGDSAAGLKLGADCVARGKKPILELSGNDGFVVWHDADLGDAATTLAECFYGSTQVCMVPKHAIIHYAIAEEFISLFLDEVGSIRAGYPEDPEVLLSPVIKTDKFFDFLSEATGAGADLLAGGQRINVDGEPDPTGLFLEPTVLRVDGLDLAVDHRVVREETFFPMLPLVVTERLPDDLLLNKVIDFVNSNPYGLRNSLWASDSDVIHAFVRGVTNGGQIKVNESHIEFVSRLATHGGTGRTGGPFGELNYPILRTTHLQGVSIARSPRSTRLESDRKAAVSMPRDS